MQSAAVRKRQDSYSTATVAVRVGYHLINYTNSIDQEARMSHGIISLQLQLIRKLQLRTQVE